MEILLGPKTTKSEKLIVKALAEKYQLNPKNIHTSSIKIQTRYRAVS